jgi:hypothetical protein
MLLAHWWRQDGEKQYCTLGQTWTCARISQGVMHDDAASTWVGLLNKNKVGGVWVVWWCGDAGLERAREGLRCRCGTVENSRFIDLKPVITRSFQDPPRIIPSQSFKCPPSHIL